MQALQTIRPEHEKEILRRLRWARLVPKPAVITQDRGDHFRFLHPTKGWKYISKKRLGFDQ
jgi:hypothetical protein